MKIVKYTGAQLKAAKAAGFSRKKPTWKKEDGERRTKKQYVAAQNSYAKAVLSACEKGKKKVKEAAELKSALAAIAKNGK